MTLFTCRKHGYSGSDHSCPECFTNYILVKAAKERYRQYIKSFAGQRQDPTNAIMIEKNEIIDILWATIERLDIRKETDHE